MKSMIKKGSAGGRSSREGSRRTKERRSMKPEKLKKRADSQLEVRGQQSSREGGGCKDGCHFHQVYPDLSYSIIG